MGSEGQVRVGAGEWAMTGGEVADSGRECRSCGERGVGHEAAEVCRP